MEEGDQKYRDAIYNTGVALLRSLFPSLFHDNEDQVLHCCARLTADILRSEVTSYSLTPVLLAEVAISRGANINACDSNYRTPLHIACHFRNYEMVDLLVEKGANVNLVDNLTYRPLDYVIKVEYGRQDNRGDLIDLLAKSKRLETNYFIVGSDIKPLHYAAQEDEADIIEALVRNGSSIHTRSKKGNTALHIASEGKRMNACKQLLLLGAEKDKLNPQEVKALHGFLPHSEEYDWLKKYEDNSPAHVRYVKLNTKSLIAAFLPSFWRQRTLHYLSKKRRLLLSFSQIFANPDLPDLLNERWEDRNRYGVDPTRTKGDYRGRRNNGKRSYTAILVEDALKYLELIDRAKFNRMAILYLFYLLTFIVFAVWIIPVSASYEQVDLVANYFTPDLDKNSELLDYADVVEKTDVYTFMKTLVTLGIFADNSTIGKDLFLVGSPLIRQIRVKSSSCLLATKENKCFDFFTGSKDKESFGPADEPDKYQYETDYPILQPSYQYYRDYHISPFVFYGQGAHSVLLKMSDDEALAQIDELEADEWIDTPTRAVAINFGYLNNNLGFATSVEYLFEFSASGRIQPTRRVTSYPLTKTINDYGASEFGYFIAIFILGVYYHFKDLKGEINRDWRYLISKWMLFEIIGAGVFIGSCITFAYYLSECSDIRADVLKNGSWDRKVDFIDFQTGAILFNILKSISAVSCMLAFLKLFKYLRLNHKMNIVGQSLFLASGDLLAFTVIFIIIFVAYAFLGYFFFGSHAVDFQNFFSSLVSTFRMLAGDFDYEAMSSANPLMAPIFTITYVILIIMILVNMFIAILTEYFDRAKTDSNENEKKERAKFSDDTEYDVIDQVMSIVPSVRMPSIKSKDGPAPKRKLLQGENVVLIPANHGSKQCSDLATILAEKKIKVLMLRCSSVDQSFVFKCLSSHNFLRFRNIREQRQVLLARRNYHDVLPETITLSSGEVLDMHWLAKKGLIATFEALNDTPLDVSIYIDIWSLDLISFIYYAFKSSWIEHMQFQEDVQFLDRHEFRKILTSRSEYFDFYDNYMRTDSQQNPNDADSNGGGTVEKAPFIFSRKDLIREITIHLARNKPEVFLPENSGTQSGKERLNYKRIIAQESRRLLKKLPASCMETFSAEGLIKCYRPQMADLDGIPDSVVSLLREIQHPIAEYLHDLYCSARLKAGYSYDETTDRRSLKNSQLKPYSEISEEDRAYSRNIIRKVVFSLHKLRYRIRRKIKKGGDGSIDVLEELMELDHDESWLPFSDNLKTGYKLKLPDFTKWKTDIGSLGYLVNILAEEMHDEWAKARMAEGYVYFDVNENPGMPVPAKSDPKLKQFHLLSQEDKEGNRLPVRNIFNYLFYLGYDIQRKNEKGLWESVYKAQEDKPLTKEQTIIQ